VLWLTLGEALIKEIYEAIRNSAVWDTSVLIITWDEHGGFYDHVTHLPLCHPGTLSQRENITSTASHSNNMGPACRRS